MSLTKLKQKYEYDLIKEKEKNFTAADYDDHKDAAGRPLEYDEQGNRITPPLQSWKDSAPVIRLSEYLKSYSKYGIKLYQEDGKPILNFNPGLRGKDMDVERWSVACQAVDLYHAAFNDLQYLLSHGLIDIPTKPERGD